MDQPEQPKNQGSGGQGGPDPSQQPTMPVPSPYKSPSTGPLDQAQAQPPPPQNYTPSQGYPTQQQYGQPSSGGSAYPPTQAYPPQQGGYPYPTQGAPQPPPQQAYYQPPQQGQQGYPPQGQEGYPPGAPPPGYYGGPPTGYPPGYSGGYPPQPPRKRGIPVWVWLVPVILLFIIGSGVVTYVVLGLGNTNKTVVTGQPTATTATSSGDRPTSTRAPRVQRTATPIAGDDLDSLSATATAIAEEIGGMDIDATLTAVSEDFGNTDFNATMTAISEEFDDIDIEATITAVLGEFSEEGFYATMTAVTKELEDLGIQIPTVVIPDIIGTPGGSPLEPERIDLSEFKRLYDDPANRPIILDVRGAPAFQSGHIDGAVNIPVAQTDSRIAELSRDKLIVAYCQ